MPKSKIRKIGEYLTINNKKVKVQIIHQPYNAWTRSYGSTVILTEKTHEDFQGEKIIPIIYHEQGHFRIINRFITWMWAAFSVGLAYLLIQYLANSIVIKFVNVIIILALFVCVSMFILALPFAWCREILADWNAVQNTKSNDFRKVLIKISNYNGSLNNNLMSKIYRGFIMHPPNFLRIRLIKWMEKKRDNN